MHKDYTTYNINYFPGGEVEIILNVVNNTIYCKVYKDLNKSLISAIIAINKLKKIYETINVIMPFLPYSRSEIQSIIAIFQSIGVSKLITIEIHSEVLLSGIAIQNISIIPEMIRKIGINLNQLVIVAPDMGGYIRAKDAAQALKCDFTWMTKTRDNNSIKHYLHNINLVNNRPILIVDDIIDTGATINSAAEVLRRYGATSVKVLGIHGVLSKREFSTEIDKIYITNTIEQEATSGQLEIIEIEL
jgi:ribose-phosphate pyrophosphokinase